MKNIALEILTDDFEWQHVDIFKITHTGEGAIMTVIDNM